MSSLVEIKNIIESLDKIRQIEILKIFLNHNISVTENKNGSFINLTYLTPNCLSEIKNYLSYVNDQDETLKQLENVKQEFIKEHFDYKSNENKEKSLYTSI
jgi:hypothetical protein|tara:strand:+ start:1479 stop:1781 length:303 start_codon:yes stop_codon:yes gene_type:complete